jgi:hypothetical protein
MMASYRKAYGSLNYQCVKKCLVAVLFSVNARYEGHKDCFIEKLTVKINEICVLWNSAQPTLFYFAVRCAILNAVDKF